MKECSFLIPLRRDAEISDGDLHALVAWQWLEQELFKCFGGLTIAPGEYEGVWKSAVSQAKVGDRCRMYVVAMPESRLPELRSLLRKACVVFGQQCLYLSVAGDVEFIEADDDKRERSLC